MIFGIKLKNEKLLQRTKIIIDNMSFCADIHLTKRRSTSSPIDSFQIAAGAILPPPPGIGGTLTPPKITDSHAQGRGRTITRACYPLVFCWLFAGLSAASARGEVRYGREQDAAEFATTLHINEDHGFHVIARDMNGHAALAQRDGADTLSGCHRDPRSAEIARRLRGTALLVAGAASRKPPDKGGNHDHEAQHQNAGHERHHALQPDDLRLINRSILSRRRGPFR